MFDTKSGSMNSENTLQKLESVLKPLYEQIVSLWADIQIAKDETSADIQIAKDEMSASNATDQRTERSTSKLPDMIEAMKTKYSLFVSEVEKIEAESNNKLLTANKNTSSIGSDRVSGVQTGNTSTREQKGRCLLDLSLEEQKLIYDTRAQLSRQVDAQNALIKAELSRLGASTDRSTLTNTESEGSYAGKKDIPRKDVVKLLKEFEKKAIEADKKMTAMQRELFKSQELARKYQQLYDNACAAETSQIKTARTEADQSGACNTQRSTMSDATVGMTTSNLQSQTVGPGPLRVSDVMRKNECLLQDNTDLQHELQKVKRDHSELLKSTNCSMTDRNTLLLHLHTSESSRQELLKRLHKERKQYQQLDKSLTRQASDWIHLRKQFHHVEEECRWEQVSPLTPVVGGRHPKSLYMPKKIHHNISHMATHNS